MLVESFSGIRGVYGKDLTLDAARRYAYVFNEFLKKKLNREPKIVVGYDTRESSEALKKAMLKYLPDVIDVGVMPVAAVELGVREFKADGGIMITASHNEPEFNGFKFLDKDGSVLRPNDISGVIEKVHSLGGGEFSNNNCNIIDMHDELLDKYCNFLRSIVGKIDNNCNAVLDVNGGAGIVLPYIVKKLGLNNIKIINDKAGEFNTEIEPHIGSMGHLKAIMENAQFAGKLDSDADRLEILLKDGNMVDGNYLLALIVDDVLSRTKGTVVTNDATSNVVRKIAEKYDCSVKEVEVGEINVVDEMLKLKSPIGGEGSNGGVIIGSSRCRDGILSVLYLLKIISEKGKSLSELINELPKFYTVQKKVKLSEVFDREKVKSYYSDKGYEIAETGDETGGLKARPNKDSFVWFRISKTEPNLLRIIADSDSEEEVEALLEEAHSLLC